MKCLLTTFAFAISIVYISINVDAFTLRYMSSYARAMTLGMSGSGGLSKLSLDPISKISGEVSDIRLHFCDSKNIMNI